MDIKEIKEYIFNKYSEEASLFWNIIKSGYINIINYHKYYPTSSIRGNEMVKICIEDHPKKLKFLFSECKIHKYISLFELKYENKKLYLFPRCFNKIIVEICYPEMICLYYFHNLAIRYFSRENTQLSNILILAF
jgi:hypothetical protein